MTAVMPRALQFRCEPSAHRVVIIDERGGVVLEFGGFGRQPGAFDTPIDAALVLPEFFGEPGDAIDQPWLAVADYGNRRVQIFELDGTLVGVIDEDVLGDAAVRPCRLVWRAPVLEVEGVDGGRARLHLGAALLQRGPSTAFPSPSPAMFAAQLPRFFGAAN